MINEVQYIHVCCVDVLKKYFMVPPGGRRFYPLVHQGVSVDWCVCDQHLLSSSSSSSSAGTKSKGLTPQWDIMAKRLSEAGRPSVSLQDEVHELD